MERGGGRESVAVDAEAATDTVSQRRVAMEVAGLAVWGGAQRRTKLTDEQVPLPLSALAPALPLEQGTVGPDYRHRPKTFIRCSQHHHTSAWVNWLRVIGTGFSPAFYKVSTPWMGGRSGHGGQWWTAVDNLNSIGCRSVERTGHRQGRDLWQNGQ